MFIDAAAGDKRSSILESDAVLSVLSFNGVDVVIVGGIFLSSIVLIPGDNWPWRCVGDAGLQLLTGTSALQPLAIKALDSVSAVESHCENDVAVDVQYNAAN